MYLCNRPSIHEFNYVIFCCQVHDAIVEQIKIREKKKLMRYEHLKVCTLILYESF